jgi:hypothetical protein
VAVFFRRECRREAGLNEAGAAPRLHGPGCAHSTRAPFRARGEDGVTAGSRRPLGAGRRKRASMTQRLTWNPRLGEVGRFGRRWGLLPLAIVLVCANPAESSPSSPPKSPTSLHSGGAVTTPGVPTRRGLACPGTPPERFQKLRSMTAKELENEAAMLAKKIQDAGHDLQLVVDLASVVAHQLLALPAEEREAVVTEATCDGPATLTTVALRSKASGAYLDRLYDIFIDFVRRNAPGAAKGPPKSPVSDDIVLCAAITPLFNAKQFRDVAELTAALPSTWLREPIEHLGSKLLSEGACPAHLLETTMGAARKAGVDSVPIRNLQFYGLVCNGRDEAAGDLLKETLRLAPDDKIIRENIEWIEERLRKKAKSSP